MGGGAEEEVRIAIKGPWNATARRSTGPSPATNRSPGCTSRSTTGASPARAVWADGRRQATSRPSNQHDLERVGDLVVNIAEAAQRHRAAPVKKLIDIPGMAGIAQGMLRDASMRS